MRAQSTTMGENFQALADFIWGVADLLRGDFKQSQYGRIILPFTVLRRLECVQEPTKGAVLQAAEQHASKPEATQHSLLLRAAELPFYNTSELTLATLSETQTESDLHSYVQSFSRNAREIFDYFSFEEFVEQLHGADLLYQVVQRFATIDLSPGTYSNYAMGLAFEELIRRFAESSNETAGEHFTPRDVVHLVTSLAFTNQAHKLEPNKIVKLYDPAAGTGGFLSEGDRYIQSINSGATVALFGQELNPESYAICKADMLIKGQDIDRIRFGNTFSNDRHAGQSFDFLLSNPPFGVDWKKVQKQVTDEHRQQGYRGRFGPGLPRVNDGAMLFLLHLIAKMKDREAGGSRIGIILNGSPLFTGGAGSGESEIRRYILENDWLEAIVALPTDMFYNTGIATYVWILSNAKPAERQNTVQLIDATERYSKMRKSLGSKRQYIDDANIRDIVSCYGNFTQSGESKVFPVETFGYRRITVERPLQLNFQASEDRIARLWAEKPLQKLDASQQARLQAACEALDGDRCYRDRGEFSRDLKTELERQGLKLNASQLKAVLNALSERDEQAAICRDNKGNPEPDPELRDHENVPLTDSVDDYFEREVRPHVADAWIDASKTDPHDGQVGIVGYEIPFNRYFYVFQPPRPLEEIDADLRECTDRIKNMIEELSA